MGYVALQLRCDWQAVTQGAGVCLDARKISSQVAKLGVVNHL